MHSVAHMQGGRRSPFETLLSSAPGHIRRGAATYAAAAIGVHVVLLGLLVWWSTWSRPVTPLEKGSFFVIHLPESPPAEHHDLVAPDGKGSGGAGLTDASSIAGGDRPTPPAPPPAPGPLTIEDIIGGPTFTPFTVPPTLANRGDIMLELSARFTPELQETVSKARVVVWMLLDETGNVRRSLVQQTSGNLALDQAALDVSHDMRFTPAMNRGQTVPVWVAVPVEFRNEAALARPDSTLVRDTAAVDTGAARRQPS